MNGQEMVDQVSDELRNTSITSKIVRWVNLAIVEIGASYIFGHLHSHGSKATAASIPDVTLDTNFHWLKNIEIPAQATPLYPKEETVIAAAYPQYRTTQGAISYYYLNGITLGLWMVPSGIFTITYAYQRRPTKINASDLTQSTDLPEEWHELVTQKATTKGYSAEKNTEQEINSLTKEKILLVRLGANLYRRPDAPVTLGDGTHARRPPRVRFPAHYSNN